MPTFSCYNGSMKTKRFNVVVAIGIAGNEEDCHRFVELMMADFEARCKRAAEKIFDGRVEVFPPQVTDAEV
jgi:hypothetical protein